MSTTTDHRTAVEIDTALAKARTRLAQLVSRIDHAENSKYSTVPTAELQKWEAEAYELNVEVENLAAQYTGWSRFFLVTNTNGHIHRSTACSTCRFDTQFAWLTELSGLTDAEAVEAYGEILCSVCFPDAPVAWTTGVSKAVQAERDERAAKAAERAAKKAAKALFPEDPARALTVAQNRFPEKLRTIAAAKKFLTDGYDWKWGHPSYSPADRDTVAAVLADRTGESVEDVLTAAEKRAAKRR